MTWRTGDRSGRLEGAAGRGGEVRARCMVLWVPAEEPLLYELPVAAIRVASYRKQGVDHASLSRHSWLLRVLQRRAYPSVGLTDLPKVVIPQLSAPGFGRDAQHGPAVAS
jgi:hypothetical protein